MSLLVSDDRRSFPDRANAGAESLFGALGGARSLDDRVIASWEDLAAHGAGSCLVCGGHVRAVADPAAGELAGTCADCGSELS